MFWILDCIFSKILTLPKPIQDKDKDKDEIFPSQHKISKDWIIYGIFPSQHKICKDRQRSGLDSVSNIFHFIMFLSQYIFLDHFDFNFFHVLRNTMLIEDNFTLFASLKLPYQSINQTICSSSQIISTVAHTPFVVKAHFLDKVRSSMFCYK